MSILSWWRKRQARIAAMQKIDAQMKANAAKLGAAVASAKNPPKPKQ